MKRLVVAIVAVAAIIAAATWLESNKASSEVITWSSPTIDFSFSLECRDLESDWHKEILWPWNDVVKTYERDLADYQRFRRNHSEQEAGSWRDNERRAGIEYYNTGVRIAFNHGLPDGDSRYDVEDLRVVRVTPERVYLRGKDSDGIKKEGFFDRRTGQGMVVWWELDAPENASRFDTRPFKQFILQCEPSKPVKF